MTPAGRLLLAAVAVLALLTACSPPPAGRQPVTVRVAAASDLQLALDEIAAVLAEQHPDVDLAVTYGSSGTFVQQLASGAPFDLYLAADEGYAQRVVDAGLAAEEDVFPYAVGRLALWAPHGSPVDPSAGLAGLDDAPGHRVAVANPAHAPYGAAAVAALRSAGVYAALAERLVLGENVAQAVDFARSGNADAGVVALPLVVRGPLADAGRWQAVPPELHPSLDQAGVVLSTAREPVAARAVRDLLVGPRGRAVLERHGFGLPEA